MVEKMKRMKYTVFSDVETFSMEEKPLPTAADDKVLIKVKACGLCGTDLLIYKGGLPGHFPYCPGHEYSGEVVQVGKQAMADRYTYVPLIGIFVIVAWGLPDLLASVRPTAGWTGRSRRRAIAVVGVLALTSLGFAAHRQVGYWQSDVTLFERAAVAVAVAPISEQVRAAADLVLEQSDLRPLIERIVTYDARLLPSR